jgi:hypothetical protein
MVILGGFVAHHAVGDTVHLTSGGKLEGTVVEEESNDAKVVLLTRAGKQTLPRSAVDHVEYRADNRVETYKDAVKRFGDSAEQRFQLALWCLKHQYRKQAHEHLREVLTLDPDHAGARERLGYKRVGEAWKTPDEINAAQGLVKDGKGKWVLPQQKDEAERKDAAKKKRTEYFGRVRSLKRMMYSENQSKAQNAKAQLTEIKDPAAVEALMKSFGDPNGQPAEREFLVELLQRIEHEESDKALVKLAIEDPNSAVRAKAAECLVPRKSPELAKTAVGFLRNKENYKVDNAGGLLAEIGDESCAPDLIDALVTKHTYIHRTTMAEAFAPPGSATWQPFTAVQRFDGTIEYVPNSADPLSPGPAVKDSIPTKRTYTKTHQNLQVLTALSKITGEDFGFDKKRWLDWLKTHAKDKTLKSVGKG